jgi:hypothetical protein
LYTQRMWQRLESAVCPPTRDLFIDAVPAQPQPAAGRIEVSTTDQVAAAAAIVEAPAAPLQATAAAGARKKTRLVGRLVANSSWR